MRGAKERGTEYLRKDSISTTKLGVVTPILIPATRETLLGGWQFGASSRQKSKILPKKYLKQKGWRA
jgi:hypothetical protein